MNIRNKTLKQQEMTTSGSTSDSQELGSEATMGTDLLNLES